MTLDSDSDLRADSGAGRSRDESADQSDFLALELDELITEYFDLQREGKAPGPDAFIAAHPEHEHALRAVLPGASLLDQLGQRAEDATALARSGERLGEFRLLGILGRGGMGVVYDAVQDNLDRPVALKVLPASRVMDRKSRERFLREAQAAASLQHPGIVPVYGVGEAEGQVYYAMQRVDGVPLDVLTAAARGDSVSSESSMMISRAEELATKLRSSSLVGERVSVAVSASDSSSSHGGLSGARSWNSNAVHIALQAAEALSYAHSRGVLHRDVKPSNLMLDDDGRVFVTDFGLCKTAEGSSLTAAGDLVGTLRYMPPERFHGRDDARGDVYGVGMILYELLSGRPAFPQRDRAELVQAVTVQSPPRPRKLNSSIPEDLETIVLTAIAQLPEERYPSMEALISDLSAFRRGRPIRARAPGKLYLARLFARRNPALVGTVLAGALLFLVTGVAYVLQLRSLVTELRAAEREALQGTYHAELGAAAAALMSNQESIAESHLQEVPESERDWLWKTIESRLSRPVLAADRGLGEVVHGSLDGDDALVALVRDGGVRISDVSSGDLIAEVPAIDVKRVAFLPGAAAIVVVEGIERRPRAVAYRSDDEPAAAWFNEEVERLDLRQVQTIDADGRRLALATVTGFVAVLSDAGTATVRTFQCTSGSGGKIALFGGDGRAVHAVRGNRIVVLGPEEGRRREVRISQREPLLHVEGARDADRFFLLAPRGKIHAFEDDGARRLRAMNSWGVDPATFKLAVSPDGRALLYMRRNGVVRLWRQGRSASEEAVRSVRSSPAVFLWPDGGDHMIVAGGTGEWLALDIPSYSNGLPGISRSRDHFIGSTSLAVDREGAYYASGSATGAWGLWSNDRRLPVAAEHDTLWAIGCMALDVVGDGAVLAMGGKGLRLVTWTNLSSGEWSREVVPGVDEVLECRWIGDELGRRLLVIEGGGRLLEVHRPSDGPTGVRVVGDLGAPVDCATFLGANGAFAYTLRGSGRVLRRSVDGQAGLELTELPRRAIALGSDREGRVLLTCEDGQVLRAHRLEGDRVVTLPWEAQVAGRGDRAPGDTSLAVDPETGWILTASLDGGCRTWALETGRAGPPLLTVYGRFREVLFPRPGAPPMALEYRGKIDHFEVDSTDRTGGDPALEATDLERQVLARCSARARLESIQRHLRSPEALDVDEVRALHLAAQGIAFFARYNPAMVPKEEAQAASVAAAELRATREAEVGVPDVVPADSPRDL